MAVEQLEREIQGQIDAAQEYASGAVNQVNSLTETLKSAISSLAANYKMGYATANAPQWVPLTQIDAEKPGGMNLSEMISLLGTGAEPPEYTPGEISFGSPISIMDFAKSAPEITFPNRPTATLPEVPDSPEVSLPDVAAAPDYTLPEVPQLKSLTLPEDPGFTPVGLFEGQAPTMDFEAPGAVLNYSEKEYESELQKVTEAWLQDKVLNGGTGLAPSVEQAIWDRGMTREAEAARRNLEEATDEFAAAGYPMPPGALRAHLAALRQDLQDRSEDLSRKVSEDQAKLAQENTHFAVDKALQLEALTMQHFNNVADRALAYARASADLGVAVFNARVSEYNTRMEAYRVQAQVHEINVRAALQELENYRTLLSAKQIEGDLRKQEVDLYEAQLRGVEALFSLHKTQLEGTKVEADIERLKLDVFRSEMDGYNSQVQAKVAEFGLYQSQIDGEKAKIDAFGAEVDAYRSNVAGKTAQIDARKAEIDARVSVETNKARQAETQLAVYRSEIERNRTAIEAVISKFAAESDLYKADIGKAEAQARAAIAGLSVETQVQLANLSEQNARFRKEADIFATMTQMGITSTGEAARTQSELGRAALSQLNAITQLSVSGTTE